MEKCAFTGADQRRAGRFETADGGTLLLDEIGDIPLQVQEKILRVVEYSIFEPVGSSESIEVDVRIIGATNADLKALAGKNMFKQDLLDRLSFEVLVVPSLRERREDIMLLANHFAGRMAVELGQDELPQFTAGAARALESYSWPGNIRELKNTVERAVYRCDSAKIAEIVFDPFPSLPEPPAAEPVTGQPEERSQLPNDPGLAARPLKEAVWELKVRLLENALVKAKFNQKKAARYLGLTYHQFRGLYRQYQALSGPRNETR